MATSPPKLRLKVVRSQIDIPEEQPGSLPVSDSFAREKSSFLVGNASQASLKDILPVIDFPAPPDGGWGWVIVAASFLCNFVLDGIAYSFGVLLEPLVKYFNSSRSEVSWVGSLLPGIYLMSGPVVGGLVNKFGCRPVCISGGIVSCVALLLSTLSVNVPMLMVTYGIVGGFGLGLVYLPAVIACGYYFEKKRALATGISVCGSGVGCFAFAPLANYLLQQYGWRGANIIFAGLCLNCCVFGAVMRPLELTVLEPRHNSPTRKHRESGPDSDITIKFPDGTTKAIKRGSMAHSSGHGALGLPTIASVLMTPAHSLSLLNEEIAEEPENEDEFEEDLPPTMVVMPCKMGALHTRRRTLSEHPDSPTSPPAIHRNVSNPQMRRIYSTPGFGKQSKHPGSDDYASELMLQPSTGERHAIVRPMSRKDIFFSGSVFQLGEDTEQTVPPQHLLHQERPSIVTLPRGNSKLSVARSSLVASHLSICQEVEEPKIFNVKFNDSDNALMRVLKEMVDIRLLKNSKFLLILLSNCFAFLALYTPYMFLPGMMVNKGLSTEKASFIVSIIGISNTVGRVGVGWVVDRPWANSLLITNISLISSGLCIFCFPACQSFTTFVIVALLMGLSVSAFIALTSIVLVDLLGLDVLTSAFGLIGAGRGISGILGPPLAGLVYEMTSDYGASFFMAGTFFMAAGIIGQGAYFLKKAAPPEK